MFKTAKKMILVLATSLSIIITSKKAKSILNLKVLTFIINFLPFKYITYI